MTVSSSFLLLSLIGLSFSAISYFRLRLPGPLMLVQFMIGWPVGELALQTIVGQGLVSLFFIRAGLLDTGTGQVALGICLLSWLLLGAVHRRSVAAGDEMAGALAHIDLEVERDVSPLHGFLKPFGFRHPEVRVERNIAYGEVLPGDKGGRNLLDLRLPKASTAGDRRPVLLQVHGGGWICVASNYRLSPKATMPDHIVDVKRAIAWIRTHIEAYGGDPDFLCITGGSAGGHLSALAALTANDPNFQPGFEEVDTRLDGAVPFYGIYDFCDRANDRGNAKMSDAIGPRVFKCLPEENPELWDSVSPITRVHSDAPPFFVIQGSHDTLVFREEAVTFVDALREKSTQLVAFAQLEGAQHAFDIFHSVRCAHAVRGTTAFLEKLHADYQAQQGVRP